MAKKPKQTSEEFAKSFRMAWVPTPEQKEFVIDEILEGKSLMDILDENKDDLGCARSTFARYLERDPEFAERIQWARDHYSEYIIDTAKRDLDHATLANYVLNLPRAQMRMRLAAVLNPSRWSPTRTAPPAAPPSFRTDAEAQARMVAQAKEALARAKATDAAK
jgi:hypothetical protein